MDSTLWPIPGQDMHNKAVVMKQVPSIQAILQQPADTDPTGIINSAPSFGSPLEHIIDKCGDVYKDLQTVRNMLLSAKTSPVYQGRPKQQKVIDEQLDAIESIQKYIYTKIIKNLNHLTLASLSEKDIMG